MGTSAELFERFSSRFLLAPLSVNLDEAIISCRLVVVTAERGFRNPLRFLRKIPFFTLQLAFVRDKSRRVDWTNSTLFFIIFSYLRHIYPTQSLKTDGNVARKHILLFFFYLGKRKAYRIQKTFLS